MGCGPSKEGASGGAEKAPEKPPARAPDKGSTDHHADWHHAIEGAKEYIEGWGPNKDLLLLPAASHHFKRAVTIRNGAPIPYNETEKGASDRQAWFEIPLNTPRVTEAAGVTITGRLFTTRMPQGLDRNPSRCLVDAKDKLAA